jgi:mRNA interferase MazF
VITHKELYRGEVYWVSLDQTIGSETRKTRPGLVISNNIQNHTSKRVIIAPLTSVINRIYPFEVRISIKGKESKVMLDQIRTIDRQRLGERLGKLNSQEMENIDKVLKFVLALA